MKSLRTRPRNEAREHEGHRLRKLHRRKKSLRTRLRIKLKSRQVPSGRYTFQFGPPNTRSPGNLPSHGTRGPHDIRAPTMSSTNPRNISRRPKAPNSVIIH